MARPPLRSGVPGAIARTDVAADRDLGITDPWVLSWLRPTAPRSAGPSVPPRTATDTASAART